MTINSDPHVTLKERPHYQIVSHFYDGNNAKSLTFSTRILLYLGFNLYFLKKVQSGKDLDALLPVWTDGPRQDQFGTTLLVAVR